MGLEGELLRSSSKTARPKRLQYDGLDGNSDGDGWEQLYPRALSGIAEEDEEEEEDCDGYDSSKVELSESDEDPPSQYSTPLKMAYSRQASWSFVCSRKAHPCTCMLCAPQSCPQQQAPHKVVSTGSGHAQRLWDSYDACPSL